MLGKTVQFLPGYSYLEQAATLDIRLSVASDDGCQPGMERAVEDAWLGLGNKALKKTAENNIEKQLARHCKKPCA